MDGRIGIATGTVTRVVVVDDSPFIRKAIARMFRDDSDTRIVGLAASGEELLASLGEWQPDVVVLDLAMPGMGGISTLDHLSRKRIPVVVLSAYPMLTADLAVEAFARGYIDFVDKREYSMVDFLRLRQVLKSKFAKVTSIVEVTPELSEVTLDRATPAPGQVFEALLIGASTGGPPAIQQVLAGVGDALSIPAVVAQHMPPRFTRLFAERLNGLLPLPTKEAQDGDALLPGHVYIAPAGKQITLDRRGGGLVAAVSEEPGEHDFAPSVDVLFHSAARVLAGRAVAVLMTGMGSDGASGLAALAGAGAYTIVQDAESSAIFGMPRAAMEIGAAREVIGLKHLSARLRELIGGKADRS